MADISQGSAATCLRCGGIVIDDFITNFTAESHFKRILKINRHLVTWQARVQCCLWTWSDPSVCHHPMVFLSSGIATVMD